VAAQHPHLLERHYGAEIQDVIKTIKADAADETETRGLRLAIMTAAADESAEIRAEIYCTGLLDALKDGQKKTAVGCAKQLSADLRLRRTISVEAILPYLARLVGEGHISDYGDLYTITDSGVEQIARREQDAAKRLVEGRQAIRNAIEAELGSRLANDQFLKIWSVFEERMVHYFTSRGDAIVAEVSAVLGDDGEQHTEDPSSAYSFLNEFATAVGATSSHPSQQMELRQIVLDLFTDRTSPATDWLVRVCSSFVAACALGLEYSSGVAVARLLSRTSLILDTDVVLSLLGEGEPEHQAVLAVVRRWTANRGRVFVAEPVLEEVSYHAHISQHDFDQTRHLIPGTADDRLHVIGNAFVRGFAELCARREARLSNWSHYISQFRGESPRDWKRVIDYLATEYRLEKLPPRSAHEESLERNVRRFLVAQAHERAENGVASYNDKDKARRDASLYAALVHHLKAVRALDPGAACLLVSSARRLLTAENEFHESGEPHLVVPVSAVIYLLSLLPDVSFGLSAMKAFLFEDRRGFTNDLERSLLRIVRSSNEVSMPFAKRGLLMRAIRQQMVRQASQEGSKGAAAVDAIERNALAPENIRRTIEMLASALDDIAVDRRLEAENRDLKQRLKELEEKLLRSGRMGSS
jgi:DNA-binding PadR family transcriptional regulator